MLLSLGMLLTTDQHRKSPHDQVRHFNSGGEQHCGNFNF